MRRFLTWVLMVLLMIAVLVGGTVGFLYLRVGKKDMPAPPPTLGQTQLSPVGWDWELPVLGGAAHKHYASSPSLGAQDLGTIDQQGAALTLPAWATDASVELQQGGKTIFQGSAQEYASFLWPEDGDYRMKLTVGCTDALTRPARPLGWYEYLVKFRMERTVTAVLSASKLPQGSVFAVYVQSGDVDQIPTAQCELGPMWFAPYAGGWIGYLPAAHNAESGVYPLTISVGQRTLPLEVEVTFRKFDKADPLPFEGESDAANQEFRAKIWPLYGQGKSEKRWTGAFSQPVQGNILQDYGIYLTGGGRSSGVSFDAGANAPITAPAAGQVVFSGSLQLTGNTVVLEHGCGVKSFFYHLGSLEAVQDSTVQQGQVLGRAGEEPVLCEIKIGNKSIDPWPVWKGSSGLFYQPQLRD